MNNICASPSSLTSVTASKELCVVPSAYPSLSDVDPDQSILYPTSITQPEQLLAMSKEIFESYDRHLSTAAITRQIHEKLITELDTSVTSKEAELSRLKLCLQMAEAKLSQVTLPPDVMDLKVKLEVEQSNLRRAEAAYEGERNAKLDLETKLRALQTEDEIRRDQAIRRMQRDNDPAEQPQFEELDAAIKDLEKQLLESNTHNNCLHAQLDEKNQSLIELQGKLTGSTSKEQLSALQSISGSTPLPEPTSAGSATLFHNSLDPQAAIIALAASRREVTRLSSQLEALASTAKADHTALQETRSELENQWKRADKHYDDMQRIKIHRDQLIESLARSDTEIADLEGKLVRMESEHRATEQELQQSRDDAAEENLITVLEEAKKALQIKTTELEDMTWRADELSSSLQAALQNINKLNSQLLLEAEQLDQLRSAYEDLLKSRDQYLSESQEYQSQIAVCQDKIDLLSNELASAKHSALRLQDQLQEAQDSASQAIRDANNACETIREERDRRIYQINRDLREQTEAVESLLKTQAEERQRYEEIVREKAATELEFQLSDFQSGANNVELQRLNKLISQLKNDDSAKEVKIMQLLKSKAELQEMMETLEIALDSKQQELELVKRKFGVRGVAGSVYAPERTKTIINRRQSIDPSTIENRYSTTSAMKASATPLNSFTPVLDSRTSRPRSSLAMGTPGLRRTSASAFSTAPLRGSLSSASTDSALPLSDSLSRQSTELGKETHFRASSSGGLVSSIIDLPNVPRDADQSKKLKLNQSASATSDVLRSTEDKENFLKV